MINTYCKSQKELSREFILLIDNYWKKKVDEHNLKKKILLLVNRNKELMYKDGELTAIVKQRLGKKRIKLLYCILCEEEVGANEE